ncbi:MAG: HEAT repeat domain-containing protein [Planctomycetes bacterium]|nr:HEAT repeat domain-containing protein [Planctomycetota bacterium]
MRLYVPALFVAAACLAVGPFARAGDGPEKPPAPVDPNDEEAALKRFFDSYSHAAKPIHRADAVLMLKGLKSDKALAKLGGLMGDSLPEVRRNAVDVMAQADDPRGTLVNYLIGALADRDAEVVSRAVKALGGAKVKAKAVQALYQRLRFVAADPEQAQLADKVCESLNQLTGANIAKGNARENLKAWQEWLEKNKENLEKADAAYLEGLDKAKADAEKNAKAAAKPK